MTLWRAVRSLLVTGLVLAALTALSGCISPAADNADLPWNTPPPWEGVPTIPGLSTP